MRKIGSATLTVACFLTLPSCSLDHGSRDPSIELNASSANRRVRNGTAYERATALAGAKETIVVPDDAIVLRSEPGILVEVFIAKSLAFYGHPAESMSIVDARKNMGCASKVEDGKLVIATFGEWDSNNEGGAEIKLVVRVPEGVIVEKRAGLSGAGSMAHERTAEHLAKGDGAGGYWYGPSKPIEGWKVLIGLPDVERTASKFDPVE